MEKNKSYAQVLSIENVAKEVLKIKEMFPKLQASKIKNIQKIIHKSNKLKPHINMTMKSLSYKQIITPMNNENKNKFIKNSSNHIININKLLKNIKSECKANYIKSEKWSVVIITDKITSALDLQTIEWYVKSSNKINADKVKTLYLLQSKLLWQPLDQCPIAAQVVNLIGGIFSGNTSCIFTRELDREPQQYSTNYLYILFMVYATTALCLP